MWVVMYLQVTVSWIPFCSYIPSKQNCDSIVYSFKSRVSKELGFWSSIQLEQELTYVYDSSYCIILAILTNML